MDRELPPGLRDLQLLLVQAASAAVSNAGCLDVSLKVPCCEG